MLIPAEGWPTVCLTGFVGDQPAKETGKARCGITPKAGTVPQL